MGVIIFWTVTGAVLAFIALAVYGARLAEKPPSETPYGQLVLRRYEKERSAIIENELAKALEAIKRDHYLVPKTAR